LRARNWKRGAGAGRGRFRHFKGRLDAHPIQLSNPRPSFQGGGETGASQPCRRGCGRRLPGSRSSGAGSCNPTAQGPDRFVAWPFFGGGAARIHRFSSSNNPDPRWKWSGNFLVGKGLWNWKDFFSGGKGGSLLFGARAFKLPSNGGPAAGARTSLFTRAPSPDTPGFSTELEITNISEPLPFGGPAGRGGFARPSNELCRFWSSLAEKSTKKGPHPPPALLHRGKWLQGVGESI